MHYPGTYAHGVYNRETTIMGGHPVPNEDLVNLPNGLVLKLRIEGDEPVSLANVELLSYRHEYDFRNALVIARAALPRSRRPRDDAAQPPLREHGPDAPGGAGLGARGRELVGPGGARLGARRARRQQRRRPLPPALGPPPRSRRRRGSTAAT